MAQQFYNIMRCALCGELLKYSIGMQCSDCHYLCHEKCYPLVVTKCISKSNAESDPDEAKINHRIPHRFETFGNVGANWCCHCGYMLPLGRKSKRCKGSVIKRVTKPLHKLTIVTRMQADLSLTLHPSGSRLLWYVHERRQSHSCRDQEGGWISYRPDSSHDRQEPQSTWQACS